MSDIKIEAGKYYFFREYSDYPSIIYVTKVSDARIYYQYVDHKTLEPRNSWAGAQFFNRNCRSNRKYFGGFEDVENLKPHFLKIQKIKEEYDLAHKKFVAETKAILEQIGGGEDDKREDRLKQTASKPIQYVKGKKYRFNGAEVITYLGEKNGFPEFECNVSKDGVEYKITASYTWEQVNAASVVEVIDD